MTLTRYRRDLSAAKRDLASLAKHRQEIDRQMAKLQPIIKHLEGLCRELGEKFACETATKVELTTGLTELARTTLTEAYVPLSAGELKKRMEAKGFDFSKYSSPLASIHTVLKRLVKSGQVKAVPQKGGKKSYQWITAIDNLLTVLGKMNSLAQRNDPKESK